MDAYSIYYPTLYNYQSLTSQDTFDRYRHNKKLSEICYMLEQVLLKNVSQRRLIYNTIPSVFRSKGI